VDSRDLDADDLAAGGQLYVNECARSSRPSRGGWNRGSQQASPDDGTDAAGLSTPNSFAPLKPGQDWPEAPTDKDD